MGARPRRQRAGSSHEGGNTRGRSAPGGVELPPELWGWLILTVLMSGLVLLVYHNGSQIYAGYQSRTDPVARAEYAREILGAGGLPPGYLPGPVTIVSVRPFFYGEELELTDKAADPDGVSRGFLKQGFIYQHFSNEDAIQKQQMRDLVRTRNGVRFDGWVTQVRVEGRELIAHDHLKAGTAEVDYVAQRAVLVHPMGDVAGLVTALAIYCPDLRTRTGLWFGPDPDPAAPVDQLSLAGTVADEAQIRSFLGGFDFCAPR